jgi:hypothetical protein
VKKLYLVLVVRQVLANPNNEILVVYDSDNTITHVFITSENGDKLLRLDGIFQNLDTVLNFIKNVKASNDFDMHLSFTFVESPDSINLYNSIFKIKYFN